jgi:hypothetical protein
VRVGTGRGLPLHRVQASRKPDFAHTEPGWHRPGPRAGRGQAPMWVPPAAPIPPTSNFRCSESIRGLQPCP